MARRTRAGNALAGVTLAERGRADGKSSGRLARGRDGGEAGRCGGDARPDCEERPQRRRARARTRVGPPVGGRPRPTRTRRNRLNEAPQDTADPRTPEGRQPACRQPPTNGSHGRAEGGAARRRPTAEGGEPAPAAAWPPSPKPAHAEPRHAAGAPRARQPPTPDLTPWGTAYESTMCEHRDRGGERAPKTAAQKARPCCNDVVATPRPPAGPRSGLES